MTKNTVENSVNILRTTLTGHEAAEYLGISYWLLLDLAKKKQIEHSRAGRRYLFRIKKLEAWLDKQELQSTQPEEQFGKLRKINI